jgi:hypothetical protein
VFSRTHFLFLSFLLPFCRPVFELRKAKGFSSVWLNFFPFLFFFFFFFLLFQGIMSSMKAPELFR